jgi:predicted SnoaL-like aldol condensation-catalyzing enzyme
MLRADTNSTKKHMQNALRNNSIRKASAVSFLKLAASGNVRDAFANYVSPTFRHHNPYFAGDAESLKTGMAEAAAKFPHTMLEVQQIFEEGELVAVHSRVQHGPNEPEISVVHIVRFEGELIAELWDVGQVAPADSPNQYGMF